MRGADGVVRMDLSKIFSKTFLRLLAVAFAAGFFLGGAVGVVGFCMIVDVMAGENRTYQKADSEGTKNREWQEALAYRTAAGKLAKIKKPYRAGTLYGWQES